MIKHFSLRFTLFLHALDVTLVVTALLIATYLRLSLPYGMDAPRAALILPMPVYFIAVAVHLIVYSMLDIHSPRQVAYLARELQTSVAAALLAWFMFLGTLYLSFRDVSRLQIIYFLLVHVILLVSSRVGMRVWYRARGKRRISPRNVLVVGTDDLAQNMIEIIENYGWTGLNPVGLVARDAAQVVESRFPVLGAQDDLPNLILKHGIAEVVIAVERQPDYDLGDMIQLLQTLPVNIRIIPNYTDLAFLQVQVENFSGMPLLTLKEPVLTPSQRFAKRLFDLTMTALLMIPGIPIMALIALAVWLDDPGPILYKQTRIGEGGRPFKMLKFRSMCVDADKIPVTDSNGNRVHKHPQDPRVTRVGRVLRRTSLDELPQLFNILRGQMSLVGPRPEMPDLVDRYEPWQRKRFEVPQGLTGWWQINGRATKLMHLHTEDDLFYIRNYSIWLDIRILWRTVWVVLSREGAY